MSVDTINLIGNDGRRRAALLLHGLTVQDRQWMLERLEGSAAGSLRPLLAELSALGLPTDPDLVSAALEFSGDNDAGPQDSDAGGLAALLRSESAARVLIAIRNEPAGLIARLLLIDEWPWHNAVIAGLPLTQQRLVGDLLAQPTRKDGHALNEALLEIVRLRLQRVPLDTGVSVRSGEESSRKMPFSLRSLIVRQLLRKGR